MPWPRWREPTEHFIRASLGEQTLGDLVHCLLVILAWEQMPVPVHGDLQRSMASECLHRLRREPGLNPA